MRIELNEGQSNGKEATLSAIANIKVSLSRKPFKEPSKGAVAVDYVARAKLENLESVLNYNEYVKR